MRLECATSDAAIAAFASRQHGVASFRQLLAAGLTQAAVQRRLRGGRLYRVHRSVYAVGHPGLSDEGRWMAAVLACGEGAALSHRSAAALWGLLAVSGGPVDVTVPGAGGRRKRRGLRIHRSPCLTDAVTTIRSGIPVTTTARTLRDLRRTVPAHQLRHAIREAEFHGLDLGEAPTDHTRSELERMFLHLCRRYRLPVPEVNIRIGRFIVDFLWRERRLVVETDGYGAHRGRQAFEDDHARQNGLIALGFEVLRFTYVEVADDPVRVAALVRRRLAQRRP